MSDFKLSQEQIETFQKEGVLGLKGAFKDWVDVLREGVAQNLDAPGEFATDSIREGEGGRFFDDYCNWERIQPYQDFIQNSDCAEIAAKAMKSKTAQLFHEHAVIKEAGTAKATPWHHDMPYYCVDGPQTVSVWIALDPVPLEATVQFVAGSHSWGKLFYPRKFLDGAAYVQDASELEHIPDIDGNRDQYEIREWACEPGDAVLFDFRTLHGTTAAMLKGRRRAIAFRWLGAGAYYMDRQGETSPPYPELEGKLKSGDALPASTFPVIWEEKAA
ncbi:phytanoyl-CoA dioxygenase family protein [Curvivirga sp.]|uniref:phytanoyl-CoA dioxygenase family protein n=1 Tax=Curvivirga sp. TaxID=2856848 RepID=UPI003B58C6C4